MTRSLQQKYEYGITVTSIECASCVTQYKPGNLSEFQESKVYIAAKKTGQYKWMSLL